MSLLCRPELISATSYFEEYADARRSRLGIFIQQCKHILRYGNPNEFYFLYGLDIKGLHCAKDYVDYSEFMRRRDFLNRQNPNSPIALLRNKFLFGVVANSLNIPTPNNIGLVEDGQLYLLSNKVKISFEEYINDNNVDTFIKSIDGECADGVYHLQIDKGVIQINGQVKTYRELCDILRGGKYLLQEVLVQHKDIGKLYNNAINTIRLETVYDARTKNVEILPPLLRVGTGTNTVDNWAVGGLAIGIDVANRCLQKYGFYKPTFGTKAAIHPNSGVKFENYTIPYLDEAISMAKQFHSVLPEVHSIGWDIAITESGPCFIEGNDNWEISLVQICSHGLQKEFDELFK